MNQGSNNAVRQTYFRVQKKIKTTPRFCSFNLLSTSVMMVLEKILTFNGFFFQIIRLDPHLDVGKPGARSEYPTADQWPTLRHFSPTSIAQIRRWTEIMIKTSWQKEPIWWVRIASVRQLNRFIGKYLNNMTVLVIYTILNPYSCCQVIKFVSYPYLCEKYCLLR